jgi:dipeptidyl aminopeptidase/acylaminoacyl peptidase
MMRFTFGVLVAAAATVAWARMVPDDRLAYIKGGDLYVLTFPDATSTKLTEGGKAESPEWTDSGQLTFRQNGNLVSVPPTSADLSHMKDRQLIERVLGASRNRSIGDFLRSPDGLNFAVSVVTRTSEAPEDRRGHLYLVRSDGSASSELFTPDGMAAVEIAGWSSDSRDVLIRVDGDFSASLQADGLPLLSVPISGGKPILLANDVLTYSDFLSISPLQQRILIVTGGGREAWRNKQLILSDPSTGLSTPLTNKNEAVAAVVWSPDARRIAYISAPDNSRRIEEHTVLMPDGNTRVVRGMAGGDLKDIRPRRLWVMNADGSDRQQLTDAPRYGDEHPMWSQDSRYILFIRFDAENNGSIWSMDLDSGQTRLVLPEFDSAHAAAYYGHLNWSFFLAWSGQ